MYVAANVLSYPYKLVSRLIIEFFGQVLAFDERKDELRELLLNRYLVQCGRNAYFRGIRAC